MYKRINSKLLIVLATLAFLSYSSSSLFLLGFCIVIDLFYTFYYDKINMIKRIKLYSFSYIYIMYIFVLYKTNTENIFNIYACVILSFIIVTYTLSKISNRTSLKLMKIVIGIYVSVAIAALIYFNDFIPTLATMLFGQREDLYTKYNHGYLYIRDQLFFTFLVILGLRYTYFNDRKIFRISMISYIFVTNYLMFLGVGVIIEQDIYHRATQLSFFNIIATFGFIYMVKLMKKHLISKYLIWLSCGVLLFCASLNTWYYGAFTDIKAYTKEFYHFDQPLYNWKIHSTDTLQLINYDYPNSNELYIGDSSSWSKGINQIFQLKTNLNRIQSCSKDCYYLVSKNEEYEKLGNIDSSEFKAIYRELPQDKLASKITNYENYKIILENHVFESDNYYVMYREE